MNLLYSDVTNTVLKSREYFNNQIFFTVTYQFIVYREKE